MFHPRPNIFTSLDDRSRSVAGHSQNYPSPAYPPEALISHLSLSHEFRGHRGCVNRLEFNHSGSLLASGSDDCRVKIWDLKRKKCAITLKTGHSNNIFANQFVLDDTAVVSGGMDCEVRLTQLEFPSSAERVWHCHRSRVKDIAVAPHLSSAMFWTSGEDGTIREFDLRVPHRCDPDSSLSCSNILVNFGRRLPLKAISLSPIDPNRIAIACEDPFIRLIDRRFLSTSNNDRLVDDSIRHSNRHCTHLFAAPTLKKQNHATFVAFDATGREIAASYHGEQIYSYSIYNEEIQQFEPPSGSIDWKSPEISSTFSLVQSTPMSDRVSKLKTLGNSAYNSHNYSMAISHYNAAILAQRSSESNSILYSNRALCYLKRNYVGDCQLAITDCETALQIDPLNSKAMFRLISGLKELKKYHAAHQFCEIALKRFESTENLDHFKKILFELKNLLEKRKISREKEIEKMKNKQKKKEKNISELNSTVNSILNEEANSNNSNSAAESNSKVNSKRMQRDEEIQENQSEYQISENQTTENEESEERPRKRRSESETNEKIDESQSIASFSSSREEGKSAEGKGEKNASRKEISQENEGKTKSDEENEIEIDYFADSDSDDIDGGALSADESEENQSLGGSSRPQELEEEMEIEFEYDRSDEENISIDEEEEENPPGRETPPNVEFAPAQFSSRRRRDFLQRFVGGANVMTDIKEANFWGNFLLAGSDCGRVFIWDRRTGRIVKILEGSKEVVNCVRGHEREMLIVSSGIDNHINCWSPASRKNEAEEKNEIKENSGVDERKMKEIFDSNQKRIREAMEESESPMRVRMDDELLQMLFTRYRMQFARGGGGEEAENSDEDN